MTKKLVLCDCLGSQKLDAEAIAAGAGLMCSKVYTNLCEIELEQAAAEIAGGDVILACQQERQRFSELAEDLEADIPAFVDLRDRAGWGQGEATPKMAALAAEAALPALQGRSVDVVSEGTCLIIGGDAALLAAEQLAGSLAVTVLLDHAGDIPIRRDFDCVIGQLHSVSGALGGFKVRFRGLRTPVAGGRGAFELGPAQAQVTSECDIILDLSGAAALVPAPHKREGYLRADPAHGPSVAKAVLEASQLVGTFEKPLYVRLQENLCAHSRAEQPACSNCLNVCPTGAITSAGEHVAIDPMICAGCGSCSAVCPSGAISYDAPPVETIFQRLSKLAATYRKAGGQNPALLVHDAEHGVEMISLAARFGRGLPAHVIPFEVEALSGFGHAEALGALGCGFAQVDILLSPTTETEVLEGQTALADAVAGDGAVRLIAPADPDALCDLLDQTAVRQSIATPILPLGSRRQITRLAAQALQPEADTITLPKESPYGAVVVDTDACTLCLSCVSLCPSGALGDSPDLPQLRFQEDACLQCGLCRNICPEKAITLEPRLDLTEAALTQRVLNEEEPFACVECGTLFGVKSTVEKITEKLAGSHAMFANPAAARMIQMCENCRIQEQFHSEDNPFQGGERPKTRTSEDYFSKRKDH